MNNQFNLKVVDETGVALSRTGASDELADADHSVLAEVYSRFEIGDNLGITPSVQWIKNSGFDDSGSSYDEIVIYGLRASYNF